MIRGLTLFGAVVLVLAVAACLAPGVAAQRTATAGSGEPRLIVNVANEFGFAVRDLKAADFAVQVDKNPRSVSEARFVQQDLVDIVLLLETSEVGTQLRREIRHVAEAFISRLSGKQQMAIAGYANSAELVQDFTGSEELLQRALGTLRFGNRPAILDSLYAVLDGAFERSPGRRIIVIVSSGYDSRNRVTREEVIQLARRRSVAIFALCFGRSGDLERIAEETAGDYYRGKELKQIQQLVENVSSAFGGYYELKLPGAALDGKLKVEVPSREKLRVNYRVVE